MSGLLSGPLPPLAPRSAPGRRTRPRRDDHGAVALVVALTVTLLVIPIAAVALDLGAAYIREADLQQIAEVAARAGGDELAVQQRDDVPAQTVMAAARTRAVQALCAGVEGGDGWGPGCDEASWAADGDPANGEVSFYLGAPTSSGFATSQDAGAAQADDLVTGLRVLTPPLRVTFGFAGAFTTDHVDLQKAATTALLTVLPRNGFFPMYLAPDEVGGFCTRSAPQAIWQPTQPTGCTNIARGYLTAARTNSAENTTDAAATTWNAAVGFDTEHAPLPGLTATLAPNYYHDYFDYLSALVRDLSAGLFVGTPGGEKPGRLKGTTCRGNNATSGPHSGLESGYLADFVEPDVGDPGALRTLIKNGTTPTGTQRGWLDPSVLGCGRLAVVPVLPTIPHPPPEKGMTTLSHQVGHLRLIWLDDRLWETEPSTERVASGTCLQRGFYWADPHDAGDCETALRAYTGYILDPRLLPATVSDRHAANTLDQYVGSGLPAAVRLIRDVSAPPVE